MPVHHIPYGEAVNKSERDARDRLIATLEGETGSWVLLSKIQHVMGDGRSPREIDFIAIGPPGILVIEVKHWDLPYTRENLRLAESEAEFLLANARKITAQLRDARLTAEPVSARFFITRTGSGMSGRQQRFKIGGVPVFGVSECQKMLDVERRKAERWSAVQVAQAARVIEPKVRVTLSGELRRFGEVISLEGVDSPSAPFHRVYRGQHPTRRDKVILHLFDLTVDADSGALERAKREFEVLQRWQRSPYVPSLLDSLQEAEHYAGEMYYFTLLNSEAPSVEERARDTAWMLEDRMRFARESLMALQSFHHPEESRNGPLLHRNITPETLRVRPNNRPLFTGFELSRLIGSETISVGVARPSDGWAAPEVRVGGLAAADARSDVYSLCKTLLLLFDREGESANEARRLIESGCADVPGRRANLTEMLAKLDDRLKGGLTATSSRLPAPEYWDEETVVDFNHSRYRIVNRLGVGGFGQTFKVVEVSGTGEEFGTYVAKIIRNQADADRALRAYRKARQHTIHPHLSALHEIAAKWQPNRFAALFKWVDGTPLVDLAGMIDLRCGELGELDLERTVLRWLAELCDALWQFHKVALVHGDVSPNNIIEKAGTLVLTDYDTVTDIGGVLPGMNPKYASPSVQSRAAVVPADDLYALAASFFQVLYDRDPFDLGKERGLNWQGIDMPRESPLRAFLEKATHPDAGQRFLNAQDALNFLRLGRGAEVTAGAPPQTETVVLSRQIVPRLRQLLTAYPGSRHGNAETRGLDTHFAEETYVESEFDRRLGQEIERGSVDLVVLFGNAGDGKTALLQHQADKLTSERPSSKQRLWEQRLPNGRLFSVNLDGSGAYKDKSANELLDEFLKPFMTGEPGGPRNTTHALAINSGKMLEWLESCASQNSFTNSLRTTLYGNGNAADATQLNPRVRLVDLNRRSLVGGYITPGEPADSSFLNALLDRFLGPQKGTQEDAWQNCPKCSAQHRCTAWASVQRLRDGDQGRLLRRRLADALQATHLRGEIHITARELRAALVFILFGLHDCDELHDDPELAPPSYYDRAFAAEGPAAQGRQGELLKELSSLDPALGADPIFDRQLLKHLSVERRGKPNALASIRRQAYFEWTERELEDHRIPRSVLSLHGARHLKRFHDVPGMADEERAALCRDLCDGIARLEDLPDVAFNLSGLPLRITPRTPTESCFWVLKPHDRFSLDAPLPEAVVGLEVLHTHLLLTYRHPRGGTESLPIGLELFHHLLALKDGAQLSGTAQEGVFAHLDLFVQRVSQEDVRELYAWHPERGRCASRVRLELRNQMQTLVYEELPEDEAR